MMRSIRMLAAVFYLFDPKACFPGEIPASEFAARPNPNVSHKFRRPARYYYGTSRAAPTKPR